MNTEPRISKTAGGIVVNPNGDVLVVSQHGDSWSLPKGHLEDGEDAFIAAKREIAEESGVTDLEYIHELGTYERNRIAKGGGDDPTELKTITMFLFRTPQLALQPTDPDNPEAKWVKKEDVASLLTHAKDKEFFQHMLAQLV